MIEKYINLREDFLNIFKLRKMNRIPTGKLGYPEVTFKKLSLETS